MLKYLNISNFAVIERLAVRFQSGLNLLTGETGSGKSIIVDSLGLLMGGRASGLQVRTAERVATVEALFEVCKERRQALQQVLQDIGIEVENDAELLIRREIYAHGRSRIFVDDQSVTAVALRTLQPFLVAIHGQGEQRSLLSTSSQMDLLDSFGDNLALRERVRDSFARWRTAKEKLSQLGKELMERDRAIDLLQYELSELSRIAPRPSEDEELAAERNLLAHSEKLLQLGTGAYTELYERDGSVVDRLAAVRRQLEELSAIDTRVLPLMELLEQSLTGLIEVSDTLRHYGDGVDFSPTRLSEIDERLALLERVKRKYNTDLQGILKVQEQLLERLERLHDLSRRAEALRTELKAEERNYIKVAAELTERRTRAAEVLSARVMEDLKFVALEQARFLVSVRTAPLPCAEATGELNDDTEAMSDYFSAHGSDTVEFHLSANPGEEPRPLSRIASGGELSRLMLTLRTVAMGSQRPLNGEVGTIIFDEIDVGIGGRVAEAVGRRLKSLAATRQVLCVTHQPQIARFADHHFVVHKEIKNGRTSTFIKELSGAERIEELARMIGGGEEGAQTTREAARWLLESAANTVTGAGRSRRRQKIPTKK